MPETYEILDKQEDSNGNVQSYLVFWKDSGETERRSGNAFNQLLIEEELGDFIHSDEALKVSEDPEIIVQSRSNEHSFLLQLNGDIVETMPNTSADVLQGVKEAIDGDSSALEEIYTDIRSNNVRRDVINSLIYIFDDDKYRIDIVTNGWLIDDFFLVTWDAGLYSTERGPEESTLKRQNNEIVEADSNNEFFDLDRTEDVETDSVTLDGDEYLLTEREVLFLSKVEWLLDGPKYHPNNEHWGWLHHNKTSLDVSKYFE